MMLWKCCTQYASKFGKLRSGHRTGKGQSSFQSQRNKCQRMLKLPHSCTHLTHLQILKILQARLQHNVCKLPDVQAGFRKGRRTWDQIANICWIIEKASGCQKNIYFCFTDYAKAFNCVDHNKLWKILQEMGIPAHFTYSLRILYAGQEAKVRTDRKQWTGSKFGKEYINVVYSNATYLTSMHRTSY